MNKHLSLEIKAKTNWIKLLWDQKEIINQLYTNEKANTSAQN